LGILTQVLKEGIDLTRIFHRIAVFLTYHVDIKIKYQYVENVHFVTKFAM